MQRAISHQAPTDPSTPQRHRGIAAHRKSVRHLDVLPRRLKQLTQRHPLSKSYSIWMSDLWRVQQSAKRLTRNRQENTEPTVPKDGLVFELGRRTSPARVASRFGERPSHGDCHASRQRTEHQTKNRKVFGSFSCCKRHQQAHSSHDQKCYRKVNDGGMEVTLKGPYPRKQVRRRHLGRRGFRVELGTFRPFGPFFDPSPNQG